MTASTLYCIAAYALAIVVAVAVGYSLGDAHPLAIVAGADIAATIVVFAFSVAFSNSSFYDPYWSVGPIVIAVYLTATPVAMDVSLIRQVLVVSLVTLWGVRLTYNWHRSWSGLEHEDWRYRDFRDKTGRAYWLVSFAGIHMFPTLIVFLGCVALYPALSTGTRPIGLLDCAAALLTAGAIWIEATADRQLHHFKQGEKQPGDTLETGLWAWCRHPNYLGEILFWWGLWLFALAADPDYWWTGVGALAITIMFRAVSLPLIDEHMKRNRPEHAAYIERTSAILPRFRRS